MNPICYANVGLRKGDRVMTPPGPATVLSVYRDGKLATVVHDDPAERGVDGYMLYWTRELSLIQKPEEGAHGE
jgi:hypothetical protein